MAEENFSAVNKTLKETTDFLKKKSAQDAAEAAKTRAVLEKTAASTGKSFIYSTKIFSHLLVTL